MRRITKTASFSILFVLVLSSTLFAKTFEREYTYRASEADSKITARSIALNQVKTALLDDVKITNSLCFEVNSEVYYVVD